MSSNNKAFNLDKQSADSGISCIKIVYFDSLEMVVTGDWEGQINWVCINQIFYLKYR